MYAKIAGTGSYVPENRMTNENLAQRMDTSDEWIRSRTGICERRITEKGTAYMAARAAQRALEDSGVKAEELDWILAATCTPDNYFPGVACQVQSVLGASKAACVDMGAACSGFLFALQTASAYVEAGMASKILVIGAETMTKVVDWEDRGTCVLFGDGAGAAVVTADTEKHMLAGVMGSDGAMGHVLSCRAAELNNPATNGWEMAEVKEEVDDISFEEAGPYLKMDGRRVFQFAVRKVPETIRESMEKAEVAPEDISCYVLHQANERILASIRKTLSLKEEQVPMNLDRYGNMAAASVPVLLDELHRAGTWNQGDVIVLAGFGAGLTWGAMVLRW